MTQSPSVSVWTNARVTLVFLSMALMCLVFVLLFIVANEEDNKIISYNQCVLKNLKGGADRVATWEIVAACGRMFTKQLSIRLEGSAKFDSITHPTTFIVDLSNPDASHRITRFSVHVASSGPVLNGKQTGEFSWSSNINIEPHGSMTFVGRWDGLPMQTPWIWFAVGVEGVKLSESTEERSISLALEGSDHGVVSKPEQETPNETLGSEIKQTADIARGLVMLGAFLKRLRP